MKVELPGEWSEIEVGDWIRFEGQPGIVQARRPPTWHPLLDADTLLISLPRGVPPGPWRSSCGHTAVIGLAVARAVLERWSVEAGPVVTALVAYDAPRAA